MAFLSRTIKTELDNGVRLCYFHRPGSSVEMQLHIASGSMHEGRFLGCGLSHFLEHMAFQGCAGFPERSVAETVNRLGGDLNAYTSYNRTCYRMQLPEEHWRQAADMLCAMVRFPELPEKRFIEERDVILRECEQGMDNPGRRLYEKFMKTMFLNHPVRYPIIGYPQMISQVTREMALEYHRLRYTPHRCVVVAVGDLPEREFFEYMTGLLGDWCPANLDEPVFPEEVPPFALRKEELIFPDPLERFYMGVRGPGFGAAELPAVELLFGVLGTGESSILNQTLVLDRALAVGVRSFCYSFGDFSLAGVSGKCVPGKSAAFRSALYRELEKAASGKFSRAGVEREKGQQYADRLRELRDPVNVAGEIAGGVLFSNCPDAGDVYLKHLSRVDMPEIRSAAEKYLDISNWVEVYQHDGKGGRSGRQAVKENILDVWQTSSGHPVVYVPDDQLPLSNFMLVIPGGALHEAPGTYGISRVLAAALTAGAGKFRENALLRKLDELGVELGISAGANSIVITFSVPSRRLEGAMSLLREILTEPRFEDAAVKREIDRCLESIKERSADPVKAAFDIGSDLLYKDHPYACRRSGKTEDIANITREKLLSFYRDCCNSGNWVCGFGGDCSRQFAEKWSEILDEILPVSRKELSRPEPVIFDRECKKSQLILKREQTVVLRMIPGPESASDPGLLDIFDILNQAENGLSSSLFKKVREERALSYSVGMNFFAGFQPGALTFYAMTVAGAENEVMALFNEEIARLGSEGLSEDEFNSAKAGVLFDIGRSFDSVEVLLSTAVMDAYYGRSPRELLTRQEKISALTRDEFNRRIKPYFSQPGGAEVMVLPAGKNK